ncbi:Dyp-type peroxidase [Microbacterium amylolyticum]|uniref:Dye decolorizing peroxidase n=1 Tax=Microbacterium amylolyticum TaxID=936337 RepID=A0ABS4ZJI4_9MICO|nr:Dyp-type peroxidase [Microbacterium amylolyticum]MBP2436636.1 dye decolorizing peroxidase [Microbacterium amylolyticum]
MSPAEGNGPDAPESRVGVQRRDLFVAAGTAAVAGAIGWVARGATPGGSPDVSAAEATPAPAGPLLPGITVPAVPQRYVLVTAYSFANASDDELVAAARTAIEATPDVPDDSGALTVTAGFGIERARQIWPDRCAHDDLPAFANDVDDIVRGGDLLLQVCAETAAAVIDVAASLGQALGAGARPLWSERGYRDAPTPEGTARTPIGFVDGIVNPRTREEQNAGVWTDPDRGDTFMVVRRMFIATDFLALSTAQQEHAIGRRRDTGAPLSGGDTMDDVDLLAKAPDGTLATPVHSHARRAHPANIGRGLMLRRSYGFDPPTGAGLIFVAFMADPHTFTLTQRRLDEADDLIRHTVTDASGCFFVPGHDFSTA